MRLIIIQTTFFFLLSFTSYTQCYEVFNDVSGIDISSFQSSLDSSACVLRDSFPANLSGKFKVFDFGFYSINEKMDGELATIWENVKTEAASKSPYYLLFGRVSGGKGIFSEYWIDLKLPSTDYFSCIDLLSPNLRQNLVDKYQALANELNESNQNNAYQYAEVEIEVMSKIGEYLGGLKECCDIQNRNSSSCTSCILNESEYNRVLDNSNILAIEIDNIIDNTGPSMGEEEIGYTIELLGDELDLDAAMNLFKQEIQSDFPGVSIKIYPCSYSESCTDFNEVLSDFYNDNVDIGILIGVVGEDGEQGTLRWQMISDDDPEPEPTTSTLDSCYYFNEEKLFTHREQCTEGITPRGVLQNLDGFDFDFDFRFADPVLTPLTLTTDTIMDGELVYFGATTEPLINKAISMTKPMIFARLAQAIPDQTGSNKPGAFDYHGFAPWSLFQESWGFDAPFDYSTKNFFLDRENYIFITDEGENVVGHNYRNMGNFLWGAATYIMGVPKFLAISGAHLNNLFGEEGWSFDAPDDQYSIKLGRHYARIMDWKTIYGGKNNVFRK